MGLDRFSLHMALYGALGSLILFQSVNWVDSHFLFYELYYVFSFPISVMLFIVPPAVILISLVLVFLKINDPLTSATAASVVTFAGQIPGLLGYRWDVVHLSALLGHAILAAIIGLSAFNHRLLKQRINDKSMDYEEAEREYTEQLKLLRTFIPNVLLFIISGGLSIVLLFYTREQLFPIFPDPESMRFWRYLITFFFLYFAYGAVGIFLVTFTSNLKKIKAYMKEIKIPDEIRFQLKKMADEHGMTIPEFMRSEEFLRWLKASLDSVDKST